MINEASEAREAMAVRRCKEADAAAEARSVEIERLVDKASKAMAARRREEDQVAKRAERRERIMVALTAGSFVAALAAVLVSIL